ncbi:MAG: RNA-binding S4 domain-containing protein [Candidatus Sericytochromatia bacterium]|nr:RNA-binding S4 domain-containing protein [Candidatus Sericytochromatia bacterium]
MITFKITTEYIELFKLLKATSLCETGGQAKHVISEGFVKVDGTKETRKACKIRIGQMVEYNDQEILVE